MGAIETFAGAYIGVQLVNGKIRPKYGKQGIVALILYPIILITCFAALIYGIINLEFGFILYPVVGIFAFGYMMLISPYFQSSKNYYIKFQNENTLNNFELYYKNKKVKILYKIGTDGKIAFLNNEKKLSCFAYENGDKMSNFTKYKIMNYFAKWLNDNKLLSNDVTTTFEEL